MRKNITKASYRSIELYEHERHDTKMIVRPIVIPEHQYILDRQELLYNVKLRYMLLASCITKVEQTKSYLCAPAL